MSNCQAVLLEIILKHLIILFAPKYYSPNQSVFEIR